jgi:putative ribosome biogenesis GTPase RsgA
MSPEFREKIAPTPVTVRTGYLGAGQTTFLNRIQSEPHGRKYAVSEGLVRQRHAAHEGHHLLRR